MTIRSKITAGPVGLTAAAALALGVLGAVPAQVAFADSPSLPSASVVDGTLTIQGTHDADVITIGLGADPSTLRVDFGGAAMQQSFDRATFTAISVNLRSGDDSFTVDPHAQFNDRPLTVFGGNGDDTIRGSDGNDLLFGGRGDDNIDGARGADTEILGRGSDTAVWLPGEGSDVIDGGRGHDTLDFVGNGLGEKFAVTADGSHALLKRDLGTITMDTERVEDFHLAALGGADTVSLGDLTGTAVRTNDIDLSSAGAPDGQLDVVTVNGTADADHVAVDSDGSAVQVSGLHAQTRITGNDSRDQLQVNTGAGNDTVAVSDAASARIGVAVDLGADQL